MFRFRRLVVRAFAMGVLALAMLKSDQTEADAADDPQRLRSRSVRTNGGFRLAVVTWIGFLVGVTIASAMLTFKFWPRVPLADGQLFDGQLSFFFEYGATNLQIDEFEVEIWDDPLFPGFDSLRIYATVDGQMGDRWILLGDADFLAAADAPLRAFCLPAESPIRASETRVECNGLATTAYRSSAKSYTFDDSVTWVFDGRFTDPTPNTPKMMFVSGVLGGDGPQLLEVWIPVRDIRGVQTGSGTRTVFPRFGGPLRLVHEIGDDAGPAPYSSLVGYRPNVATVKERTALINAEVTKFTFAPRTPLGGKVVDSSPKFDGVRWELNGWPPTEIWTETRSDLVQARITRDSFLAAAFMTIAVGSGLLVIDRIVPRRMRR